MPSIWDGCPGFWLNSFVITLRHMFNWPLGNGEKRGRTDLYKTTLRVLLSKTFSRIVNQNKSAHTFHRNWSLTRRRTEAFFHNVGNGVQLIPISHPLGLNCGGTKIVRRSWFLAEWKGWEWRGLRVSLNRLVERDQEYRGSIQIRYVMRPETHWSTWARFRRQRVNFVPRSKSGSNQWAAKCKAEVPNLKDLMLDDLRCNCDNSNRNKGHSKCNVLKSSQNHLPRPRTWKNCHPQNPSLCQKGWGPLV